MTFIAFVQGKKKGGGKSNLSTTVRKHQPRLPKYHHDHISRSKEMRSLRSTIFALSRPPTRLFSQHPQKTATHYTFFPSTLPLGPPPQGPFQINPLALRTEFLTLQAKHHPDKQPPRQRTQAESLSASINEAYRTLADPLLRAEYLLRLQGLPLTEMKPQEDLLAAVMDAHETIERAVHKEEVEGLRAQMEDEIAASERVLGRAFAEGDLEAARREAGRLRYWVNIRGKVRDWEEGRGDSGH